jgi:ribosome biogenesis GTPase
MQTNEHKGRIIKGLCGNYDVAVDASEGYRIFTCPACGHFRHSGITPLIGDYVTLRECNGEAMIMSIDTRKNAFIRPPVANIDYIFVVISSKKPAPVLRTADMLISIAENNCAEPIIIVNKEDLAPDIACQIYEIYSKCGFSVFSTDAKDSVGTDALRAFASENLVGKCSAFAGASGVGKSTLLNALFPDLQLKTGEVSYKTQRGKHTTRQTEIFTANTENGICYIADTPGFSLLDFEHFDFYPLSSLTSGFREIESRLGGCKYTKCSHTKEEGCVIVEAVKNGEIPKSRHESYVYLHGILKNKKEWD